MKGRKERGNTSGTKRRVIRAKRQPVRATVTNVRYTMALTLGLIVRRSPKVRIIILIQEVCSIVMAVDIISGGRSVGRCGRGAQNNYKNNKSIGWSWRILLSGDQNNNRDRISSSHCNDPERDW